MKKFFLILIVAIFILPNASEAQRWKRYRYEWIVGAGTVNLFGDFGGAAGVATTMSDFDIEGTRPMGFVGLRYRIRRLISLKTGLSLAYVNASDDYTTNKQRFRRGGNANTFFIEPSAQIEFSLLKERFGRRYTFENFRYFSLNYLNTYVFVGLAANIFFPNVDVEIDSGVGDIKHLAAAFPMGIGFKYGIDRVYSFGLELGLRYTTTDYLDGFSDKYSKANDSYIFLLFSVSRKLRTMRIGARKF